MGAPLRPGSAARLGLTNVLPGRSCRALIWAILARLREANARPVPFLARACPSPYQALQRATGKCPRHLDSWSMPRDRCREVFTSAVARPETGVLIDAAEQGDCQACVPAEKPDSVTRQAVKSPQTRNFETLCQWLDLPRLGLVDVRRLQLCRQQRLPVAVDALLLDGVDNIRQAVAVQTELEALWRVPVLGHLQLPAPVRELVDHWHCETPPSIDLFGILADHLSTRWDEHLMGELMQRPSWPREFEISQQLPSGPRTRIAIAQDEAFGWCFPEALDALERAGATLVDFSPLRSERLPENIDLVYIGCGHPERYAAELSRNHCLMQSLRSFAANGGRIYAEASGAAYLSRQLILPAGGAANMAGLLPINARFLGDAVPPEQAELTFGLGCWFAERGTALRGYRAAQWQLDPCGSMLTYAQDPSQRCDVLGRSNVLASRILFNIAAHPALLERFARPSSPLGTVLRTAR
jgi:cobyrinic acid a,c-diamide synthase